MTSYYMIGSMASEVAPVHGTPGPLQLAATCGISVITAATITVGGLLAQWIGDPPVTSKRRIDMLKSQLRNGDVHETLAPAASNASKSCLQRLLIIEDERDTARLVEYTLQRAGYEVHCAGSVADALSVIGQIGLPHLAVVDIMLPGTDGFEFCQQVQHFSDLPIVLLSAINETDTVVRGIRQYAEDYVTKPFNPRELAARVERVLRRIGDFAYTLGPVTHVDDHLAVDFARQQAFVRGAAVAITPVETKILYILMRNAGRVVATDFLLRRLWPFDDVFEDTLRVHIHRLRQKIEPNPARANYILTERGAGYSFPHAN
jgi:DNA-binding response OmpR family regulator